tara:strand:- start:184 stop:420 length:237 start_codon:yes stop_codon:yes gene_type:complete
MTNSDKSTSENKIKLGDSEYSYDSLPDEAKKLFSGLRTADTQLRMHEDTLRLISIGKAKMIEDLKKILEPIESINNEY